MSEDVVELNTLLSQWRLQSRVPKISLFLNIQFFDFLVNFVALTLIPLTNTPVDLFRNGLSSGFEGKSVANELVTISISPEQCLGPLNLRCKVCLAGNGNNKITQRISKVSFSCLKRVFFKLIHTARKTLTDFKKACWCWWWCWIESNNPNWGRRGGCGRGRECGAYLRQPAYSRPGIKSFS